MIGRPAYPAIILCIFLLFAFAAAASVSAQEKGDDPQEATGTQSQEGVKPEELPKPIQEVAATVTKWPDTFAWRTATTGTGSFPFTYFFTNLVFDLARFGISGFDTGYAPWPFRNQSSAGITQGERIARIGTAFGFSLAIGLLDAILSKP